MIKNIYKKINSKLSLYIFGNPNRFNYNLFNFFYKYLICKNDKKNKKIDDLVKIGYFKSNKASNEFVNFLKKNIIDINFNSDDVKPTIFKKKNISLNIDPSLRKKIIDFIKTNFKEDLIALENYYNNKIAIGEIQVKRNLPLDNVQYYDKSSRSKEFEVYSNYYHADAYVNTHLKMWINLQDVGKENGPLHIYSKSSSKKFIKKNKYKDRNNYKVEELEDDVFINSGQIGDTLFANTTECLHRAGIPEKNNHRDIMFVSFIFIPKKISNNDLCLDYYSKIDENLVWSHSSDNIVFKTKPKKFIETFNLLKEYYYAKIN